MYRFLCLVLLALNIPYSISDSDSYTDQYDADAAAIKNLKQELNHERTSRIKMESEMTALKGDIQELNEEFAKFSSLEASFRTDINDKISQLSESLQNDISLREDEASVASKCKGESSSNGTDPTSASNTSSTTATPIPNSPPQPEHMGTEFIIAFPKSGSDTKRIHIYIVSTLTNFSGTITSPIPGVSKNFTTSNGRVIIRLPVTVVLPEGNSNFVMLIQTSEPVAVYGMLTREYFISEGFYIYPTRFLRHDYVAATSGTGDNYNFIAILSTADNTEVNVTINDFVSYNGRSYSSGSNIRISMDRLEAVQLLSPGNLSGSAIHSNKPVAVLSGNQCTYYKSSFCNYLVEYLAPNTACGRRFIVPPFNGSSKWLRIFPTGNRANILITGTSSKTSNSSETISSYIEKRLEAKEPYAIISDNPVCVYMLLVVGKSPMLTAIPSLDQYVNDAVVPVPTINPYVNLLSIVTKTSSLAQLRVDNRTLSPSNVTTIKFDGVEYSTFWIHLDSAAAIHRLTGASNADVFGVIAYGYMDEGITGQTYGYPVERGLDNTN